ncbi:ADP-ribosylglycohydrolase, partial [Ascodesmis nigricans]
SLLSLAMVDALGAPVEFCPRDTFPPVTNYLPTRHFSLPPGTPTDDTSMALCLATSLLSMRTFSPSSQAANYIRWFRHGYLSATGHCFDIGNCTRKALKLWEQGEAQGLEVWKAEKGREWPWFKEQKGNGGLMRVLPVALVMWREPLVARRWARESSKTTHPAVMSQLACEVYVELVGGIIRGEFYDPETRRLDKKLFVERLETWEGWKRDERGLLRKENERSQCEVLRQAMTGVGKLKREKVSSSGYVLSTLQAAIWAFLASDGFVEGARLVVNLGDDADTVGAVYGGLAGAWYGGVESDRERRQWWKDETVTEWRRGLQMAKEIVTIAEDI